jgi:hypothetical protein
LFGKLAGTLLPGSKEAGIEKNCNGKQSLCTAANGMLNRQKMSNLEHVITIYQHQKGIINLTIHI